MSMSRNSLRGSSFNRSAHRNLGYKRTTPSLVACRFYSSRWKDKVRQINLAEQIAEEISENKKVLYLALEYNIRMAQAGLTGLPNHQIHLILEGEINRMGQGGERELEDLYYTTI